MLLRVSNPSNLNHHSWRHPSSAFEFGDERTYWLGSKRNFWSYRKCDVRAGRTFAHRLNMLANTNQTLSHGFTVAVVRCLFVVFLHLPPHLYVPLFAALFDCQNGSMVRFKITPGQRASLRMLFTDFPQLHHHIST